MGDFVSEQVLKFFNVYGFPTVALVLTWAGLYWIFVPLAKQIVAKHIEAVDALTLSAGQNAKAVEKISDMMSLMGDGISDLGARLERIDARIEAERALALQASAAAAAAHSRLDKINAPPAGGL